MLKSFRKNIRIDICVIYATRNKIGAKKSRKSECKKEKA